MTDDQHNALQLSTYHRWLASKHVFVRSDLVETTQQNVVAGWGCVAKADIPEGTVLFRIPRSACFVATKDGDKHHHDDDDDDDDDDESYNDPTTKDTQKDLALHLLKHKHSSTWAPFLDLLTPQSLPWAWNEAIRNCLRGTELEHVVQNKILRIQAEYESIRNSWDAQTEKRECITYQDYLDATSIVASHANPWFGVSIVPFNTTLNWGTDVNVQFDLEHAIHSDHHPNDPSQEVVVGRALHHISNGTELFQQYGESVAEVVYRCGFAPQFHEYASSDSVSLFIGNIVRVVEKLSSPEINDTNSAPVNENPTKLGIPKSSIITHLPARIEALKKSGAIDAIPWDGMEECLSAELSSPSSVFIKSTKSANGRNHSKEAAVRLRKRKRDELESEQDDDIRYEERSSYDDGGISKLVGICLVLAADDEAWQRTSTAVDNIPDIANQKEDGDESDSGDDCPSSKEQNETESRSDDIAASVLLASLGNLTQKQSTKLQQLSLDVGIGGHDPWRALLQELSNVTDSKKTLKWEIALEAAKLVIRERMDRLMGGEESCRKIKTACPEEQKALDTIQTLQLVEKSLLSFALKILDIPFR